METHNHLQDAAPALIVLRREVLREPGWAAQLADAVDLDGFVARLLDGAAARGLAIEERQVRDALRSDPLGLLRFASDGERDAQWPPHGWLPVHVDLFSPHPTVHWAYFAPQPIRAPFFEGAVREALSRPINQFIRYRMALTDFVTQAPGHTAASARPAGLIFHMSRCGSTLVSQMLAQNPHHIVILEAAPLDAAVRLSRLAQQVPAAFHVELLRAMAIAYGRRRSGREQRLFIKLDSWHAMMLPLFLRAFPDVPWVFLYRDPVEVLVSHAREPATQMLRQITPPALYGLHADETEADLDYTARVLARSCGAAAEALASPAGLAVNYRDLPNAIETRILPHFRIEADTAERAAMRAAARFDAKMPNLAFSTDKSAKQAAAPRALRDLAHRSLGEIIRRLDAIAGAR